MFLELFHQQKTVKVATDARDFIKVKTNELLSDKNEEIVLHNDVIRSTTIYEEGTGFKIKQNEVPSLGKKPVVVDNNDDEFWKEDSKKESQIKEEEKEEKDDDIHFI